MNQFSSARLRLTFFYAIVLAMISFLLTGIFYQKTTSIINLQYHRLESRLADPLFQEMEDRQPMGKNPDLQQTNRRMAEARNAILRHELDEASKQIKEHVIILNVFVIVVGTSASYVLSGLTLQPIKKSLETQQRFVADAAHELKTPITALRTSLEVSMMDQKLPKSIQSVLKDNLASVLNLEKLAENLLSLARVEKTSQPVLVPIQLSESIDESIERVQPLANRQEIKIKNVNETKNLKIIAHRQLLTQVMVILLDNAIKYSPKKTTVTISVRIKGNSAQISIIDQGIGIPKDKQKHIFDRFFRVDDARTKSSTTGHGLGLSVAKESMEALNGKIDVQDAPGKKTGTEFILTLPLA